MNKVLPGLFVGNYRDSKDAGQLERFKISHIVAIHDAARRIHHDKEYLCIMASDTPYQNLAQYFPICNDFIHTARTNGGNVLIHCLAGMSRSVAIAIAYIMSITTLQLGESQKVLRGARPVSCPNSGFQKQLQEFEGSKLFEERRRLLEKFPGTTFLEVDEEYCKRLLVSYNNLLISRRICEGRCTSARSCPTGICRARSLANTPRNSLSRQSSSSSSSTSASNTNAHRATSSTPRHTHHHPPPETTSVNSSPVKYYGHQTSTTTTPDTATTNTTGSPFRTVSCPNTPLKSMRQRGSGNNNNSATSTPVHSGSASTHGTPNPGRRRRHLPAIHPQPSPSPSSPAKRAVAASIGAVNQQQQSPQHQSSWERHYGCLNATLLRNRAHDMMAIAAVSNSLSSPSGSPIRYVTRPAGASTTSSSSLMGQRTDSMTSIGSVASLSSIMSLPAHTVLMSSGAAVAAGVTSSPHHHVHLPQRQRCNSPMPAPASSASSSPSNTATSILNQRYNQSLASTSSPTTMSCPATPRRRPTARRLPASPGILSGSGKPTLAVMEDFDEFLTVVVEPTTTSSVWAVSPNSYNKSKSSSTPEITSSHFTSAISEPHANSGHSHNHGHGLGGGGVPATTVIRGSRQLPAPTGITRWVMKRSAYRYTMDNSYK